MKLPASVGSSASPVLKGFIAAIVAAAPLQFAVPPSSAAIVDPPALERRGAVVNRASTLVAEDSSGIFGSEGLPNFSPTY